MGRTSGRGLFPLPIGGNPPEPFILLGAGGRVEELEPDGPA